jgi:heme-degrading monooxygenase HmoA
MVARVARLHISPEGVDDAVEQVRGMLEEFHGQPGFRSLTTLVSRATGECLGISVWEDAEAERASRELGRRSRETSSEAGGTVTAPDVDVYEVGFEARAVDVA